MTTKFLTATLLVGFTLTGCSSNTDSTKKAEKLNDEKIDKQAVAASTDDKDKAKDIADDLVELTSMGMTEYELSKIASQRATNPQVKAYAQQAMNDHQRDERELRTIAKQLNVTLPSAMANEGKDRIDDLNKIKTGTAFDVEYLGEMTKVNDKAIDVADDLKDNAPADNVKTFAKKLIDDDKKHRDLAKQIKNVLD